MKLAYDDTFHKSSHVEQTRTSEFYVDSMFPCKYQMREFMRKRSKAHLGSQQTSVKEFFPKCLMAFSRSLFSKRGPSQIFHRVLNTPLGPAYFRI